MVRKVVITIITIAIIIGAAAYAYYMMNLQPSIPELKDLVEIVKEGMYEFEGDLTFLLNVRYGGSTIIIVNANSSNIRYGTKFSKKENYTLIYVHIPTLKTILNVERHDFEKYKYKILIELINSTILEEVENTRVKICLADEIKAKPLSEEVEELEIKFNIPDFCNVTSFEKYFRIENYGEIVKTYQKLYLDIGKKIAKVFIYDRTLSINGYISYCYKYDSVVNLTKVILENKDYIVDVIYNYTNIFMKYYQYRTTYVVPRVERSDIEKSIDELISKLRQNPDLELWNLYTYVCIEPEQKVITKLDIKFSNVNKTRFTINFSLTFNVHKLRLNYIDEDLISKYGNLPLRNFEEIIQPFISTYTIPTSKD